MQMGNMIRFAGEAASIYRTMTDSGTTKKEQRTTQAVFKGMAIAAVSFGLVQHESALEDSIMEGIRAAGPQRAGTSQADFDRRVATEIAARLS